MHQQQVPLVVSVQSQGCLRITLESVSLLVLLDFLLRHNREDVRSVMSLARLALVLIMIIVFPALMLNGFTEIVVSDSVLTLITPMVISENVFPVQPIVTLVLTLRPTVSLVGTNKSWIPSSSVFLDFPAKIQVIPRVTAFVMEAVILVQDPKKMTVSVALQAKDSFQESALKMHVLCLTLKSLTTTD